MTSHLKRANRRADILMILGSIAAAAFVMNGLWRDPAGRSLTENDQDHVFFEWVLANAARTVVDHRDPFFTDWLGAPHGVNLMANTSMWTASLPLTPVTLLAGPGAALAVLLTVALAGTATGWYLVLSRHLVGTRTAAVLGGAFCGFAPGMIAQATGHPNIAGQALVPFLVLATLRLGDDPPVVRRGLALAALVVAQFFVNEEILLLTALALGLFALVYAGRRPAEVRARLPRAAATVGLAATVSVAVLGYPLWVQFAGPQSYHGLTQGRINAYGLDLASYVSFSRESLAGHRAAAGRVSTGVPEQNTFFGWPLLALLVYAVARLRHRPAVRALAVVGLLAGVFSLGTHLVVNGHDTRLHAPWQAMRLVPLLDSVIPARFGLVVTAVAGILLALLADDVLARHGFPETAPSAGRVGRRAVLGAALVVALLPVVPTPLTTSPIPPTDRTLRDADWRRYLPAGGTVLVLPFDFDSMLAGMRWQASAGVRFRLAGGYFLGPAYPGGPGVLSAATTATWTFFAHGVDWRDPPPVTGATRAALLREARRWGVDTVVLAATTPHADVIRATAQQVYGPAHRIGDVWFWPVSTG